MKKYLFGMMFVSLCLVMTGCVSVDTTGGNESMEDEAVMEDERMEDDGVELILEEDGPSTTLRAGEGSSEEAETAMEEEIVNGVRTIKINASTWLFSPDVITAKKGEKVRLEISSSEGIHGFAVPGLSMNVRIEPGKPVTVDLPTDTAGTFEAFCSIPCGSGHRDMKATVRIQ